MILEQMYELLSVVATLQRLRGAAEPVLPSQLPNQEYCSQQLLH
jgi:hypothetical protein